MIDKKSDQLEIGSGFDQNYCIDGYDGKKMIKIAEVKSEKQVSNSKLKLIFLVSNSILQTIWENQHSLKVKTVKDMKNAQLFV